MVEYPSYPHSELGKLLLIATISGVEGSHTLSCRHMLVLCQFVLKNQFLQVQFSFSIFNIVTTLFSSQ